MKFSLQQAAAYLYGIAGADPIIAIDINDKRLDLAMELGAAECFNAKDNAIEKIRELCPQGLGYAFDTTGINTVIEDAFSLLSPKSILGIVGASNPQDMLCFNETEFMGGGRTVMGILGGDNDISGFISELIGHHLDGRFPFEKLIGYFDFSEINEAIEAGESGHVVKPVLRMSPE